MSKSKEKQFHFRHFSHSNQESYKQNVSEVLAKKAKLDVKPKENNTIDNNKILANFLKNPN